MTAVTDDSGAVIGYERRYHNDNGAITRLDSYDKDQQYLRYVLYDYDNAGRLYTETFYSSEGFAQSRSVYTYDDAGRLAEKAYEQLHGEVTVECYDADGNVVEKIYYDTDGQFSYREVMENGAWVRYDSIETAESD